jgi:anti-sigma B factor antagonist
MSTPGFSVRLGTDGDVTCVAVTGEIDIATADHLRASVSLALSASHHVGELVIDLGAVTFCDSSGLQALVNARRACSEREIAMILLEPSRRVRDVIKIAGLDDYFTITP